MYAGFPRADPETRAVKSFFSGIDSIAQKRWEI